MAGAGGAHPRRVGVLLRSDALFRSCPGRGTAAMLSRDKKLDDRGGWTMRLRVALLGILAAAICPPSAAHAQSYPTAKPIRMIIPAAAAGASDIIARATADHLEKTLGQRVIVDSRPGAGGNLGADITAKSPPDGYTLCLIQTGNVAVLGAGNLKRLPAAPEIPTVDESGVPGYEFIAWFGIVGPRGLPPDIVALLNRHVAMMLDDPVVQKRFEDAGMEPLKESTAEFARRIRADYDKFAKVVKAADLKPE